MKQIDVIKKQSFQTNLDEVYTIKNTYFVRGFFVGLIILIAERILFHV